METIVSIAEPLYRGDGYATVKYSGPERATVTHIKPDEPTFFPAVTCNFQHACTYVDADPFMTELCESITTQA
jgi:hypothetical protein